MKTLLSIIFIVVLIGLFIFTYLLNKRTPKPDGCEDIGENCEGCNITSCSHHKERN